MTVISNFCIQITSSLQINGYLTFSHFFPILVSQVLAYLFNKEVSMKNNQKNTLFLSSALQDSLNRISHMYDDYLQTIFSSDSITSQIGHLQEEMFKSYKHFFQLYTPSIISSLTNSLSIMSEAMTAAVRDNITTNMYNNLSESLKTMISLQSLQQQLIDIAPEPSFDHPDNLNNLPEDDFVIVDESAVKIYEFPDCIYIPIGNSRIKMPTSILLTIINLIISTIITISIAVVQFNSSQEDQIKQTQIEETQIELQRAQNKILQQLLHNIDTSSSSEAEAIKELQKTVEEQNKQYSQNQDTCLSVEENNDNSKLTKDTDTPK